MARLTYFMKNITKKIDKKLRHYSRIPKIWTQYQLSDKQDGSERYVFHHLPKCAGTSAVDALTNWFMVLKDYPVGWSDENKSQVYQKFCDNSIDLDKLKPYQILVGHYHLEQSFLHQRYPNWKEKGYKVFTFFRDPLELRISLYHYEIRNNRFTDDEPLEKQLLQHKQNYVAGLMPCDDSNYMEVLQRYFFIGIVEKYQESFDWLSKLIGKPPIKLKTYNESTRKSLNLSDDLIAEFKEINQLDYKIYNYGKNFFENQKQIAKA
jgi:hypothetical protein